MLANDNSKVDSLSAAMQYYSLGWSVIPIAAGKKIPALRSWKPFQKQRANEQQIRDWFDKRDDLGLAVVLGAVSGGLTCRDFDEEAAYHDWAAQNRELAKTLPTVKSGRGYHVYFLSDCDHTEKLHDGELRGDGSIVVLPPSKHPSGVQYKWLIPPTSNIPRLDYREFQGSLPTERQRTGETETQRDGEPETQSNRDGFSFSVGCDKWGSVIDDCIPTNANAHERNRKIFELAQWLKSDPELKDAGSKSLEPIVREWHQRALPFIGTKPFSETIADFEHAWDSVKFPKGRDIVRLLWLKVKAGTWPIEAEQFDSEAMRWLLALCLELQRANGPGRNFFLSCRSAANVLDRDHTDVAKWLKKFVRDGLLKVFPQDGHRDAHRYRYLGPSWNESPG
ncbi:MAG: bifunctional DNA primase/polymerase [Planctomycetaceae bacterium]|nr:bifunctional DNA primase/polymerase [Planctomycetaceae bacterium]